MGHHDAALGQDQLDVTQAQAEDVIQPHGVADDLGRKPVPGIGGGFECHAVSLARPSSQRQPRLTWQCQGKQLDPRSLIAAEFMILGTSLLTAGYPAKDFLTVYRLHWQIELAFKQLK